jgi:hypothetical protein
MLLAGIERAITAAGFASDAGGEPITPLADESAAPGF